MAIGPGIYMSKYKNSSLEELKQELNELESYLLSGELQEKRLEEINKGIDDNNCITNVKTAIQVLKELIANKTNQAKTNEVIEKQIDIPNSEDVAQNTNLELISLIKQSVGNDPFWTKFIENFFEKLNKSENEKIMFLKYLIRNKEIFNELVRDITGEYNADKLFEKYNKNSILSCPNCGERLSFMMPDGTYLFCNKCGKNYKNNDGKVGEETSLPDTDPNVLY